MKINIEAFNRAHLQYAGSCPAPQHSLNKPRSQWPGAPVDTDCVAEHPAPL